MLAGDWPQILGPHRNGHADNETLADNWVQRQPTRLWQVDVGSGYAGPAVVGEQILIFHRTGPRDNLASLTLDGKQHWTASWQASYRGGMDADDGPRCVPLVHDDRVFVLNAAGDLHCVNLSTGEKLWSRPLARDYDASDGYFGVGSTPIVVDNQLLVNVGGRQGAGIVAIDPATGATQWKAIDDQASYSSPTEWVRGHQRHAIFVTRLHAVGMEPTSGKEIFRMPFGRRGPTVNAAMPLLIEPQLLFLTASYGIGAQLVQLESDEPRIIWSGDDILSSQYPTPAFYGGHLFGVHGREDGQTASLRCVEARSGKVRWEETGVGMAHLIVADQKLLVLRTNGELLLLRPTPRKYTELGRHRLSNAITRALPALASSRIYVRDTRGKLSAWSLPR